eukprot:274393-Chlamydomonas_euryale.AAC.1
MGVSPAAATGADGIFGRWVLSMLSIGEGRARGNGVVLPDDVHAAMVEYFGTSTYLEVARSAEGAAFADGALALKESMAHAV